MVGICLNPQEQCWGGGGGGGDIAQDALSYDLTKTRWPKIGA